MRLELLPAVDVQGGQAVQLTQGVAGSEKVFGDPLAAALRWQDGGAEWLHLVDLDGAFGRGSNGAVVQPCRRTVHHAAGTHAAVRGRGGRLPA